MIGSKGLLKVGVGVLLSFSAVSMVLANMAGQHDVVVSKPSFDSDYDQHRKALEDAELQAVELKSQMESARSDYKSAVSKRDSLRAALDSQVDQFYDTALGQQQISTLMAQYAEQLQVVEAKHELVKARERALSDVHKQIVKEQSKVDFLETQIALRKEAEDRKLVAKLSGVLRQDVNFSRDLTFRCGFGLTLRQCLEQKNFDAEMPSWISDYYLQKISSFDGVDVSGISVNREYFNFKADHTFQSAQVDLNNIVSARVDFSVKVEPHRVLPCMMLGVDNKLCDFITHRLHVRSNRHADEVVINGKSYGETPVIVSLESGVYDLEVIHGDLRRTRKVELDADKKLFIKF